MFHQSISNIYFIRKKHMYKIQVQFQKLLFHHHQIAAHSSLITSPTHFVRTTFLVVLPRTPFSLVHVCVRVISAKLTTFDLIWKLFYFLTT